MSPCFHEVEGPIDLSLSRVVKEDILTEKVPINPAETYVSTNGFYGDKSGLEHNVGESMLDVPVNHDSNQSESATSLLLLLLVLSVNDQETRKTPNYFSDPPFIMTF